MGNFLRECGRVMQEQARTRGVMLHLQGLVRLGSVSLHKGTLQRAFVNLLQRALDAMPQGGTYPTGPAHCLHSVVEIRDTGSHLRRAVLTSFLNLYTVQVRNDRSGALCRARNRCGPPWDHRRPERARPGHHVYGDVAPRSHGGNAPRLKRRQQRTTRGSSSFSIVSVPSHLASHQGRYQPCSMVADGARPHPHLPAPEGRSTTSLGPDWHAPCTLLRQLARSQPGVLRNRMPESGMFGSVRAWGG